jgi:hypothetical protein
MGRERRVDRPASILVLRRVSFDIRGSIHKREAKRFDRLASTNCQCVLVIGGPAPESRRRRLPILFSSLFLSLLLQTIMVSKPKGKAPAASRLPEDEDVPIPLELISVDFQPRSSYSRVSTTDSPFAFTSLAPPLLGERQLGSQQKKLDEQSATRDLFQGHVSRIREDPIEVRCGP